MRWLEEHIGGFGDEDLILSFGILLILWHS
jgi:hypothetical protein